MISCRIFGTIGKSTFINSDVIEKIFVPKKLIPDLVVMQNRNNNPINYGVDLVIDEIVPTIQISLKCNTYGIGIVFARVRVLFFSVSAGVLYFPGTSSVFKEGVLEWKVQ